MSDLNQFSSKPLIYYLPSRVALIARMMLSSDRQAGLTLSFEQSRGCHDQKNWCIDQRRRRPRHERSYSWSGTFRAE
ncbi:hypothetical protein PANT111_120076 [Pantoea brenneri]|uniref:Uncharacterized protein n=1 Tax=Pantoea brenneri TaxID=472694 RepID=A0AAX3J105_9GAMM|nr:hypothetical protein PANT111_120076 [Pantoea brenneri]